MRDVVIFRLGKLKHVNWKHKNHNLRLLRITNPTCISNVLFNVSEPESPASGLEGRSGLLFAGLRSNGFRSFLICRSP
jgi:hypothetical protein